MASTTLGVATLGLEPPMTPGLTVPVSWYLHIGCDACIVRVYGVYIALYIGCAVGNSNREVSVTRVDGYRAMGIDGV